MITNKQLPRFIIVGGLAALTNFIVLILIVEFFHWHPLVANILAFLIAFQVGYWCHRYWTFDHKKHNLISMLKYFMVQCCGFFATEVLFAFFLHALHWYYPIAFIISSGLVSLAAFLISKFWAFK